MLPKRKERGCIGAADIAVFCSKKTAAGPASAAEILAFCEVPQQNNSGITANPRCISLHSSLLPPRIDRFGLTPDAERESKSSDPINRLRIAMSRGLMWPEVRLI
jgi:hypothetical protein